MSDGAEEAVEVTAGYCSSLLTDLTRRLHGCSLSQEIIKTGAKRRPEPEPGRWMEP